MDPEVISQLLSRHRDSSPVSSLTPREREVLSHMAEGRSNAAIAGKMFITEKAIGKHTNAIFGKLGPGAERGRQPPGARRAGLPGGAPHA